MNAALLCLALTVYHEARAEPVQGQAMVAAVVLNRVDDPRWPDTICAVVRQPHQFSWYRDGISDTPYEAEAWLIAQDLAGAVLTNPVRPTAAVYYHADYVRPVWRHKLDLVAQVGSHLFYK